MSFICIFPSSNYKKNPWRLKNKLNKHSVPFQILNMLIWISLVVTLVPLNYPDFWASPVSQTTLLMFSVITTHPYLQLPILQLICPISKCLHLLHPTFHNIWMPSLAPFSTILYIFVTLTLCLQANKNVRPSSELPHPGMASNVLREAGHPSQDGSSLPCCYSVYVTWCTVK